MSPLDYHALAPEIILAITVMGVLVVDLLPVRKAWTAVVGLVGLFLAFIPVLTLGLCDSLSFCEYTGVRSMFGGSYVVDTFSLVLKGLFLGAAFVAVLISTGLPREGPLLGGRVLLPHAGVGARRSLHGVQPRPRHHLRLVGAGDRPDLPAGRVAQGQPEIAGGGAQILHHRGALGIDPAVRDVARLRRHRPTHLLRDQGSRRHRRAGEPRLRQMRRC